MQPGALPLGPSGFFWLASGWPPVIQIASCRESRSNGLLQCGAIGREQSSRKAAKYQVAQQPQQAGEPNGDGVLTCSQLSLRGRKVPTGSYLSMRMSIPHSRGHSIVHRWMNDAVAIASTGIFECCLGQTVRAKPRLAVTTHKLGEA
jgi:hypothetical protein